MKKTNLILLIVLALVGSAAAWYLLSDKKTNLSGYDFNFAVPDTANVGKIFLADRAGKTITLTRQSPTEWQVNNRYKARKDVMNNLLEVVATVELMYRLPRQAVPTVVKDIATNAVKVEIYAQNGKKLKSYYVGGVNMDETGTHMMMEDANEPYAVHIPHFDGALRVRYFTDEIDWRDRTVFGYTPEAIQSVSIEYPLQKNQSFKLSKTGKDYTIEPFYPLTPKINIAPNKGLIETFLMGFRRLGAEGFENGNTQTDSIRATLPFAIIALNTEGGVSHTLKLHPIVPRDANGVLKQANSGAVQIERYYGETETGDLLLIQHQLFEKIFWGYPSFF